MKLSLQLKLGQQLAMTPQLQQAIKLLQLSTLDLQQEIHQALESNPMLELIEGIEDDENSAKETDTDSEPLSDSRQPRQQYPGQSGRRLLAERDSKRPGGRQQLG